MRTILKYVPLFPHSKTPVRVHPTDAGLDVFAAFDYTIKPGEVVKVSTGLALHAEPAPFPIGGGAIAACEYAGYNEPGGWTYAILAWDKSGYGARGVKVLGGVIDDPYTGEVFVVLAYVNTGFFGRIFEHLSKGRPALGILSWITHPPDVEIKHGQKVAQILVQRVELPTLVEAEALEATDRGANGFASSGL